MRGARNSSMIIRQRNVILDFLGKVVIKMGGDTNFPRFIPKSVATIQSVITVVLDSALTDVPSRISDDLFNVVKYLGETVVPTRARSDLDLLTSSGKS